MVEVAFLGRLLFGQDVTVVSMLALDFTGAGEGETLLGSGFGLHCRHYFTVFFVRLYFDILGLLFRRDNHEHALAFEAGHLLGLAVFQQGLGKLQQLLLALFLVDDAAAAEEDVDFDLVALLEEADGVVEFELEVVVVGLRAEAYLLDDNLCRVGLAFLLALLLLVEELLVLDDFAHRRVGLRRDHHQIQTLVVGAAERLLGVENDGFHAFADDTHHRYVDALVDEVVGFFADGSAAAHGSAVCAGVERCCYNFVLLF